jgi:Flp pilus assembly pilin Flp
MDEIMRRRGVQIIEEALLIVVALIALSITIGALGQVQAKLDTLFTKAWEGLDWLFKTVFYFIPE